MLGKSSIAAPLQLAVSSVYILLGVVSLNALGIVGAILFEPMGFYGGPYGNPYFEVDTLSFFSAVILPVVIGVIGLLVFLGFLRRIEPSWVASIVLNIFGIIVMLGVFSPMIGTVLSDYSAPSPPETWIQLLHSYDWYFSVLYVLVPLAGILSLLIAIYSGMTHEEL